MPAPFPPNDTAIVRFRYTKAQPAGDPIPPPPGSPAGTLPTPRPARGVGTEDTEIFKLDPPARDIAEVERQWREKNPPESEKEWQDALFPGPEAAPRVPPPLQEHPGVDAQGLRHRAAGQGDLPGTVTEGVPVPGRGVGFAEGEDHADSPTFGDDKLTLAQLDGLSDEQLLEKPGIGDATVKKIHAARRKASK